MKKTLKIFSIILLVLLLTSIVSADSWSKYFDERDSSYKKVRYYEEKRQYSDAIQRNYDYYYDNDYYKPNRYNPGYKYYNYKPTLSNYNTPYVHSKYRNDDDYVEWKEDRHEYRYYSYDYRDTSPYYYNHYSPSYDSYSRRTCYFNAPKGRLFYTPCR